ncbi:zinc finger protein on ecdysone puffs isoform X1 [Euwallacea fornicatus]|uniref:zinc finger protein on ecdysone puffs isoform X1 n=1 Tax=Euwallacea fornicatus TaxID=995702 RepID=UPI003390126D
MVRGGRGYSARGGSYRGSSRGSPWHEGGGRGGYGRSSRGSYSYDSSYDKGRFSERFNREEYAPKPYRGESSYSRERHSPERKRPRHEAPSRHEYSTSRYESYPPERRSYTTDRHHAPSPYTSRREEFRKPPPPPSPRGSGRGRISSSRGLRGVRRERGGPSLSHKLNVRSYAIRKRGSVRGDYSSRFRLTRFKSRGVLRRRLEALTSDEESSGEEVETVKVKKEESVASPEKVEIKKEILDNEEEAGNVETEASPKKEKNEELKADRAFVELVCPQCNIKLPTFRRYELHLQGHTHLVAMRKVAIKQRSILAQMRQAQRNAQNELEKSGEGITVHTVFCPLCKLNYKQERAVHQATAAHKNMKKFLMPSCKVCKKAFKSPMVYEHHLCSVDHLKRKQKMDGAPGSGDEDNLEEFTTIDSVGEVGDEAAASSDEKEKQEKEKKKKVSVGMEQIMRIEAYYCDLCRMFLPIGTENEYPDILAGHCRKRFHLARYVRQKESEDLKKKAEKLQRKETAEKEKKEEIKTEEKSAEDSKPEEEEAKEQDTSAKSVDEDKIWDAVDKDLGELLEETDGREDDDDEDRLNGERYDRLTSDKADAKKDDK